MDQINVEAAAAAANPAAAIANKIEPECDAQKRCVDARNYEKFRLAKIILNVDVRTIGSQASRDRIEAQPFSGHGDDIVRKLASRLNDASAQPTECGDFNDQLERFEKARDLKKIKALFEGQFRLIEALSIDPPEPANDDDRKKIIGFNSIAAHIKLSVYELGINKDPALLAQAECHFKKALKYLLEWNDGRPKLWKVRRLKMVTNLAVIKQHLAELEHKGIDELESDLEDLCNDYDLIEDLVWYSTVVPRVHHYFINAVELCSILNKKEEWFAAMNELSGKVDNSKFRREFIAKCYEDTDELPTFKKHFEWLTEYNQSKTQMRTVS